MTLTVQCKSCVDQIQQIARYFKLFTQFLLILGKSCMAGCYSNSKTEKRHPYQMNLTSSQMGTNNFIGCFILLAVTYKTYFDVKLYERYRSSRLQMFFKIVVLRNFEIFTGKHLCWSLQTCNFIKKRLQHRCFPVNISNFLRTASFIEHLLAFKLNSWHASVLMFYA